MIMQNSYVFDGIKTPCSVKVVKGHTAHISCIKVSYDGGSFFVSLDERNYIFFNPKSKIFYKNIFLTFHQILSLEVEILIPVDKLIEERKSFAYLRDL